jgi:hypothetical protein
MTDETSTPAGGDDIAVIEAPADTGTDLSVSEAGRALAAARNRKPPPAESAEPATADNESASQEADAARSEQDATGETQEDAPAEKPLRELPRSWTKDRAEHWAKLDPDTQEFLLEQDRKASAEVRRVQNEAAEKLKGLTAKEQQADQARQQYEAKLKSALEVLEREQLRDFPDIKSLEDLEQMAYQASALAATDPFEALRLQGRLTAWRAHQDKLAGVFHAAKEAEGRQAQEHQSQWTNHVQTENAKAAEFIPELADEKKAPELHKRAAARLAELGFKPDELNDLASGKAKLSIYDHRIQQLIFSDLKLKEIQSAKAVAAKPDIPPVQRPGTAKPSGNSNSERIQALEARFNQTGDIKDATALRVARMNAAQRRAS